MTDVTTEPSALYSTDGHVATITLNRPHAMNAVDAGLSGAVGEAIEEFERDDALRVLVLTGNGRAFCAGADLKRIAAGEDTAAPGHPEWGFAGFVEHPVSKPVVAAVNGFALGGGTEIVLAADLAVMSVDASLGLPEVKRGLFAAAGGVIRLPQQVPAKLAMEYALTGDPIAAQRALELGLVNAVVPPDDVLPAARDLAERIAANAPISVRVSKRLARAASGTEASWVTDVWALNHQLIDEVFASADAREGATAFAEKRSPEWTGR